MTHLTSTAGMLATALATAFGSAPSHTSQAQRLEEYRQTIVALYRVPVRSERDPLDQLWNSLAEQYAAPRPLARS